MWADYLVSQIEPKDPDTHDVDVATITYLNNTPNIKVGGGYKKYIIEFEDGTFRPGIWKYYTREKEDDVWTPFTEMMENVDPLHPDEIKIHFGLDRDKTSNKTTEDYYEYLDNFFKIEYITNDGIKTSLESMVVSL